MKLVFMFAFILSSLLLAGQQKVYAASGAECAIWICLPGGFPAGCAEAYGAFRDRIKRGRAPLPELRGCTTGPNGESVDGKYQLGREIFEACELGYVLREDNRNGLLRGKCYLDQCAPERYKESNEMHCKNYEAVRRVKQNYVKMWAGGSYLGQFWYE